jgi:NTP pyrophosphatase (non-canonical NTP hydrolase)
MTKEPELPAMPVPVAWLLRPIIQRYPDLPIIRGVYYGARTEDDFEFAALDGDEYSGLHDADQMRAYATAAVLAERERNPLTFDAFRAANVARCLKWHPAGIESWSPSDWLTAVTGELGELASLLKMRNRERDGLPGNKFSPTDRQVADELADVLTYLDLLAEVLGIDLGRAAAQKFNEVSERVGFPDRIAVPPAKEPT